MIKIILVDESRILLSIASTNNSKSLKFPKFCTTNISQKLWRDNFKSASLRLLYKIILLFLKWS